MTEGKIMSEREYKMLGKISTGALKCNGARAKTEEKDIVVYSVSGKVSGIVNKEGQNGDMTTGLTGEFYAVKPEEPNVIYRSGILYLPSGISESFISAVIGEGTIDDKGNPIYNRFKMAVEVTATPANNQSGYTYTAKPLMEVKPDEDTNELIDLLAPPEDVKKVEAKTGAKK